MGFHTNARIWRLSIAGGLNRVVEFSPALLLPVLVIQLDRSIEQFWWVAGAKTGAALLAASLIALADRFDPKHILVLQTWLAIACTAVLLTAPHAPQGLGAWLLAAPAVAVGLLSTHIEVLSQRTGRGHPAIEGAISGRFRMVEAIVGHPARLGLALLAMTTAGLGGAFGLLLVASGAAAVVVSRDVNWQRWPRRARLHMGLAARGLVSGALVAAITRGSMYAWWGGAVQVVTHRGHSVVALAIIGSMALLLAPLSSSWGRLADRHERLAMVGAPAILALGWVVTGAAGMLPGLERWTLPGLGHWTLTADVTAYVLVMGLGFALLDWGDKAESIVGQLATRNVVEPETMWTRSALFRVIREVGGVGGAIVGGKLATIGAGDRSPGSLPGGYGSGELLTAGFGLTLAVIAIPARILWLRRHRPQQARRGRRRAHARPRRSLRSYMKRSRCLWLTVFTAGTGALAAGLLVGPAAVALATRDVTGATGLLVAIGVGVVAGATFELRSALEHMPRDGGHGRRRTRLAIDGPIAALASIGAAFGSVLQSRFGLWAVATAALLAATATLGCTWRWLAAYLAARSSTWPSERP